MNDTWYQEIPPSTPLTQGDLILNCPLITWKTEPIVQDGMPEAETLKVMAEATRADVVVMTQACDLENNKVHHVVLCPYYSLSQFRKDWEADMVSRSQRPTDNAWKRVCQQICNGYIWNLTILNSGHTQTLSTEHCIVDFHQVYTVPRNFLESFLEQRHQSRLRLLPPYREHLSQAFARFFMRVGLPVAVAPTW